MITCRADESSLYKSLVVYISLNGVCLVQLLSKESRFRIVSSMCLACTDARHATARECDKIIKIRDVRGQGIGAKHTCSYISTHSMYRLRPATTKSQHILKAHHRAALLVKPLAAWRRCADRNVALEDEQSRLLLMPASRDAIFSTYISKGPLTSMT
jgi:hypothetical protein